jgi:membrane-bound lytic murein transglycosylase B
MRRLPVLAMLALILNPSPAWSLDVADHPALGAFIGDMVRRHGFNAADLQRVFSQAELKPKIVEAMERPSEARPYFEYKKAFLDPQHLRDGLRYWNKYGAALTRAENAYGVPPEIVLGIIGVETHFGRNRGDYRVLDALTTLTLQYPPRADFFRSELEQFLLLTRELRVPPESLRGSYAGAVGIPQFIPSSYRRYAVDFDGDGVPQLAASPEDAIGSIANFLRLHGWRVNEPASDEARLEGTLYFWIEKLGMRPSLTVADLAGYGVYPLNNINPRLPAALLAFEGEDGPFYRLAYPNFYTITRYNRSKRYALAVLELSALIKRYREGSNECAPCSP